MPRISAIKEIKIKEAILHLMFQQSPVAIFTCKISQELARDEEYIKKLLLELEKKALIVGVRKNSQGKDYSRRIRWRLDTKVYDAYKKINDTSQKFIIDSRIL